MNLKLKNIIWGYAFLLLAVAYITGLFIDLTGDSGLYAAIARQMVESGDWLNLKINGNPYEQKPHLFFWLAGMGIKIFGNTNFAFKIFPALYGWVGFYFTYKLGKTLFSREVGQLAALFVATSQVFFLYLLDVHTDSILQTGVTLALWQLAAYLRYNKTKNFIFGFIGIGLAMLSKGPVGAVIPFFSVLFYLINVKKYRQILHPKWLIGIIIIFIIISPTLIHLYRNFGLQGVEFYFITNNFGRISGEYAGSSTDPFFYIYNSIWMFLPWTVLVFTACFYEIKSWITNRKQDSWGIFLLGSVLAFLIIISVAKGKAPNYFLIAVSPLLIISAKWLVSLKENYNRNKINLIRANYIFLSVFGLVLLITFLIYAKENTFWFVLIIILSTAAPFLIVKKVTSAFQRTIYFSMILIGSFNVLLNIFIIPKLASYQGARQVLNIFEKSQGEKDKLYNWDLEEYELFFYLKDSVSQVKSWDQMIAAMKKKGTWLYTNEPKYKDILKFNFQIDTVYVIHQRGMNSLNLEFLNPSTRKNSLNRNYLIVK